MRIITHKILWWLIPLLCVIPLLHSAFYVFAYHMEVKHDMIALIIAVDERPDVFSDLTLHHSPAKEFMHSMTTQHVLLGRWMWSMFALLAFLIIYLTTTL